MVTGEERKFANANGIQSSHIACTVEMTSINTPCKKLNSNSKEEISATDKTTRIYGICFSTSDEVAVIDEIQLLKDPGRGWAWTRAFLGLIADEVHVCGEAGAAPLLERLCETTGECVEVKKLIPPLRSETTHPIDFRFANTSGSLH